MHAQLVMRDGAWPAGYNVDEDILLYKTSGSNLARDFYVLPNKNQLNPFKNSSR